MVSPSCAEAPAFGRWGGDGERGPLFNPNPPFSGSSRGQRSRYFHEKFCQFNHILAEYVTKLFIYIYFNRQSNIMLFISVLKTILI